MLSPTISIFVINIIFKIIITTQIINIMILFIIVIITTNGIISSLMSSSFLSSILRYFKEWKWFFVSTNDMWVLLSDRMKNINNKLFSFIRWEKDVLGKRCIYELKVDALRVIYTQYHYDFRLSANSEIITLIVVKLHNSLLECLPK